MFYAQILSSCHGQLTANLYCGEKNCYDLLEASSDDSKSSIAKKYRKLARHLHPDNLARLGKSPDEIEEGTAKFMEIANAYEILKDEQSREEYDYYLAHPEEYYYNYYRYYRRKVHVDVRYVIFGTISVISVFQYLSWMTSYNTAINYMVHNSKYRLAAKEEAKSRGLWVDKKKQKRLKTKEELKQEEEDLLRSIIEEKMDIRGGYQKPEIYDVLWMQLILLPYSIYKYIHFYVRWYIVYNIKKQEYTDDDKIYLICKNLGKKIITWDLHDDKTKLEMFRREIWIKENAKEYIDEKTEEAKIKMAEDPKMKRYRRWMNKGGPGRITFEDD